MYLLLFLLLFLVSRFFRLLLLREFYGYHHDIFRICSEGSNLKIFSFFFGSGMRILKDPGFPGFSIIHNISEDNIVIMML